MSDKHQTNQPSLIILPRACVSKIDGLRKKISSYQSLFIGTGTTLGTKSANKCQQSPRSGVLRDG